MLDAAYHWLGDREKAGLIPLSFGKVRVDVPQLGSAGQPAAKPTMKTEEHAAIVFDWDGFHYFYNDGDGMLAKPLPKNPVTSLPLHLVLKEGDAMESLYFVASYARSTPTESAVVLPPPTASTPPRPSPPRKAICAEPLRGALRHSSYRIDRVPDSSAPCRTGCQDPEGSWAAKGLARPTTSMPQEMPGDSEMEQVCRPTARRPGAAGQDRRGQMLPAPSRGWAWWGNLLILRRSGLSGWVGGRGLFSRPLLPLAGGRQCWAFGCAGRQPGLGRPPRFC